MKNKSITEIKKCIADNKLSDTELQELKQDPRKGVQKLWSVYQQRQEKQRALEFQFTEMCQYEQRNYINGCDYIAGMDEAGRGPLAGPVVAAAVILPKDFKLLGLDDSKRLTENKRNEFFSIIKEQAISYGLSIVSNEKIDQLNIYEATKHAMYDAVAQLKPNPDHVLIDAVPLKHLPCTSESITKGDQKSISIAAASILAKVTRDTIMKKIHIDYPYYDFASNMGYGTKHHIDALKQHGSTPFHRKSFAPVKVL